jgi:aminopeptidase N
MTRIMNLQHVLCLAFPLSARAFVLFCVLQLDKINHQVASRVAGAFTTFKQFDKERQAMMVAQMKRIAAVEGLSENVFEIASKTLQQVS